MFSGQSASKSRGKRGINESREACDGIARSYSHTYADACALARGACQALRAIPLCTRCTFALKSRKKTRAHTHIQGNAMTLACSLSLSRAEFDETARGDSSREKRNRQRASRSTKVRDTTCRICPKSFHNVTTESSNLARARARAMCHFQFKARAAKETPRPTLPMVGQFFFFTALSRDEWGFCSRDVILSCYI